MIKVWVVFLIGFVMFAVGVLVGVFWTRHIERGHRVEATLRSQHSNSIHPKRAEVATSRVGDHNA